MLSVLQFQRAFHEPDWTDSIAAVVKAFRRTPSERLDAWLFPDTDIDWDKTQGHLTKASNIIKSLATAWNAGSVIRHEAVPFLEDIIAKPGKVELCFRFDDGEMYAQCSSVPPTADFEIDNPDPLINEEVTLRCVNGLLMTVMCTNSSIAGTRTEMVSGIPAGHEARRIVRHIRCEASRAWYWRFVIRMI